MKNYKEISSVVIFAILVHSALTASLVNIFISLHGVGGGVDKSEWADQQLYFSNALNNGATSTQREVDSWLLSSHQSSCSKYNFQEEKNISKKKMIPDGSISLETYSAMLSKERRGGGEGVEESIESMRRRAKRSKFRYMR